MEKGLVILLVFGIAFAIAQVIACGVFASKAAAKRDRDTMVWFMLGFLFGPIALLALIALGRLSDDEL
jgi:hypothetical protein